MESDLPAKCSGDEELGDEELGGEAEKTYEGSELSAEMVCLDPWLCIAR
jgi:hypothetical protein